MQVCYTNDVDAWLSESTQFSFVNIVKACGIPIEIIVKSKPTSKDIVVLEPLKAERSFEQHMQSCIEACCKTIPKIVVFHPADQYNWAANKAILDILIQYQYPPDKIFWISGDFYSPDNPEYINKENMFYWQYFAYKTKHLTLPNKSKTLPHKKFILPIYAPRTSRRYLLSKLSQAGMLEQGHISCVRQMCEDLKTYNDYARMLLPDHELYDVQQTTLKHIPVRENNFLPQQPLIMDKTPTTTLASWNHSSSMLTLADFYRASDFVVSAESGINFQKAGIPSTGFLTEKTFIAIRLGMPFVVHGESDLLQSLQQQGYLTFADDINEEYDKERDFVKRTAKCINAIQEFCSVKNFDIFKKTVNHNYNTLMNTDHAQSLLQTLTKVTLA